MQGPATNPSLLRRLRSSEDQAAWEQFVENYAPLLLSHATRRGLGEQDARDVVQETMRRVFLALPRFDYQPTQAKFRTWLYQVVENQVRMHFRSVSRKPSHAADTKVFQKADANAALLAHGETEAQWEAEWERRVFQWAAGKVRGEFSNKTWEAFWRSSVLNDPPEVVAEALGMSRAAVYMARSRCAVRLREFVKLTMQREGDPSDLPSLPDPPDA